ncbi:MAG: hypothetical protein VXY56_06020, partial [Pseudomonadota bacterium]|nr:hypothetical protein [Pseudomonadota bacterium]
MDGMAIVADGRLCDDDRVEMYGQKADELIDRLFEQLRREQLTLTSTRSFAFWRLMQMHRGWRTVFSETGLLEECLD